MTTLRKDKADANPTKAFFVRMITRDISLEDCILDLIDNSIDAAWTASGSRAVDLSAGEQLKGYSIKITAAADRFEIVDNCGGITLDDAAEYAFTFGRKESDKPEKYTIGVYGIGMKRAVFKMGADVLVRSTYSTGKTNESFKVPIDVDKWLAEQARNWDFDIEPDDPLASRGVQIVVRRLHEPVSAAFSSPKFIRELKRTSSRDYTLHIKRGLEIMINGEAVSGWNIEILQGEGIAPMRYQYEDVESGDKVRVEIVAGMAAPPPDTSDPDEAREADDPYGWHVVCNGRIVLAADKTEVSGWGTDQWPQWHPQYAGFLGIVVFSAENAAAMPLTTTKRNVDTSSGVFLRARPKMREASKQWIAYTNARRQSPEQAREIEARARTQGIVGVSAQPALVLPALRNQPRVRPANINYAMPLKRVRALAEGFGDANMSYRDVGINSFEHAYRSLVGEE